MRIQLPKPEATKYSVLPLPFGKPYQLHRCFSPASCTHGAAGPTGLNQIARA